MLISIIIPVYNVVQYLDRCLESVISQTVHNWEVVIVDDGSTDGSEALCDKWGLVDNVRVFHQINKGLSAARNKGILEAKGNYVLFLDSDDYLEKDAVQMISEKLECYNPDVLFGKAYTVDDSGIKKAKVLYQTAEKLYSREEYCRELNTHPQGVSFCAQFGICSRSFLINNKLEFVDRLIHEDEVWTPQIILKANSIYFMDSFFYYHYVREGSIMHSEKREKNAINTLMCCKILNEFYKSFLSDQTIYLRDRMAMLFMRALPDVNDRSRVMKEFGRMFAISNSHNLRNRCKGLLILLSPRLYCLISTSNRRR